MLADFSNKVAAVLAAGGPKGPKDGLMNLFVAKNELYMGLPIGWDGETRKGQDGSERCPYMLLYLCKCSYDRASKTFTPMGKPVTMKASGTFLAPFGIVTSDDVKTILDGNEVYVIQTKSGGTIKVNNRDIEIVLADSFNKVDDAGQLVL